MFLHSTGTEEWYRNVPAMTYLHRRPGSSQYYFRRCVPDPLRQPLALLLGKDAPVTEVKASLGTPDLKEAKRLAYLKALEVDDLFKQAAAQGAIDVRNELSDLKSAL